jgi:hypothetical protein
MVNTIGLLEQLTVGTMIILLKFVEKRVTNHYRSTCGMLQVQKPCFLVQAAMTWWLLTERT